MTRPRLTGAEHRALRRQVVVGAVLLVACVPAFAWVVATRELSFAGSFGLFGGHWMLGVLMPIAVLSLVAVIHALGRLWADTEAVDDPGEEDSGEDDRDQQ